MRQQRPRFHVAVLAIIRRRVRQRHRVTARQYDLDPVTTWQQVTEQILAQWA